jgi:hypothetical protein
MKKIVLLPLDERPCNFIYPKQLFNHEDIHLVLPDQSIMGNKKIPGDLEKLSLFLKEEAKDAYGLVVSMEALLYGGIVPSRLHHETRQTLLGRLQVLKDIKSKYPELIIYAFDLIMRCPQYSSSDEEPAYYETHGKEIFQLGFIGHKIELGIATDQEKMIYNKIKIPTEHIDDYMNRRAVNLEMNIANIKLVNEGIIDFLIIPQDDAAEYGHTAKNQEVIHQHIRRYNLETKVYMYPGADEVANTLLSRMLTTILKIKPKFYITYPSITSGQTIPLLEDRYLDTTVKYQIRAAGGSITTDFASCDIALFVNASATKMASSSFIFTDRDLGLTTLRNMPDFIEFMHEAIDVYNKPVVVADVATLNGSDHELMQLMLQKNLLFKLAGYAGWNTSSNTLGTCIPQGIVYNHYGMTQSHLDFLASRYVEDYGYMSYVRNIMNQRLKNMGLNYFNVKEKHEQVAQMIRKDLVQFLSDQMPSVKDHIWITKVWMPWRRMFEVGVEVTYKP